MCMLREVLLICSYAIVICLAVLCFPHSPRSPHMVATGQPWW